MAIVPPLPLRSRENLTEVSYHRHYPALTAIVLDPSSGGLLLSLPSADQVLDSLRGLGPAQEIRP